MTTKTLQMQVQDDHLERIAQTRNPSSGPPASSPPLLPAFFGRSLSCPKNVSILDRTASCLLPTFVPDRPPECEAGRTDLSE